MQHEELLDLLFIFSQPCWEISSFKKLSEGITCNIPNCFVLEIGASFLGLPRLLKNHIQFSAGITLSVGLGSRVTLSLKVKKGFFKRLPLGTFLELENFGYTYLGFAWGGWKKIKHIHQMLFLWWFTMVESWLRNLRKPPASSKWPLPNWRSQKKKTQAWVTVGRTWHFPDISLMIPTSELGFFNISETNLWYCWWFRNAANSPVELGSLSHYL